ncbi:hypothetical protein [Rhodococcus sp. NPDC059234]|uniref:hypothetical protein n=1 Tax=Rhodococcus sp. NPDC059234 TaxID=3346781 RepID=UPI003670F6C1
MSRIPWTRYEGDDIEAVAAMCICRERPTARRIRPSRGDGGIDVYVPLGDDRVEVYQVKKFAENLTSSHRGQILKSYKGIKDYAAKRGWSIQAWHLTMPLDPTPENDEWFEELTSNDPFETTWKGLAAFDNWAADFRQVIDYYLDGGRSQLEQEMSRFAATASILLPGVNAPDAKRAFSALEPATVRDRLALLRATLNDADPHYQYDITVGSGPAGPPILGDGYPALVASVSNQIDDQVVTVHILARCAESQYERPITHKGTIVVDRDSEEEREWQKFLDYGRTPSRPIKIRDFITDLPGGLGGTTAEGMIHILEIDDPKAEYDRTLSVLSPDGESLGEVPVHFSAPSSNHDGTGLSTHGTDPSGVLTVEILSKHAEPGWDITFNFTLGDVTGHFVADIAPALAFVHNFTAPNTLRIADPRVPRLTHDRPISTTKVRNNESRAAEIRHDYVQALATIQQYADIAIKVPDLSHISPDDASEVIRTGRLLRDTRITVRWDQLTVTLHKGLQEPEGPQALLTDVALQITVDGTTIPLGLMRAVFEAGEVAERRLDKDGDHVVVFHPALGKTTAQLIWAGPDSISA